jgi:hypothetical protein
VRRAFDSSLEKVAQLLVVVAGFFVTVQLAIVATVAGAAPPWREGVVLLLALALAIRYWWVILLLAWPTRWPRILLLLLAWAAPPVIAVTAGNAARWAIAIAALSIVGCATEIYNGVTRQWVVGSEEMTRSLRGDHVSGAISTAVAAALLVIVAALRPAWLDVLIPVMVLADWVRLIVMIERHQRFLTEETVA